MNNKNRVRSGSKPIIIPKISKESAGVKTGKKTQPKAKRALLNKKHHKPKGPTLSDRIGTILTGKAPHPKEALGKKFKVRGFSKLLGKLGLGIGKLIAKSELKKAGKVLGGSKIEISKGIEIPVNLIQEKFSKALAEQISKKETVEILQSLAKNVFGDKELAGRIGELARAFKLKELTSENKQELCVNLVQAFSELMEKDIPEGKKAIAFQQLTAAFANILQNEIVKKQISTLVKELPALNDLLGVDVQKLLNNSKTIGAIAKSLGDEIQASTVSKLLNKVGMDLLAMKEGSDMLTAKKEVVIKKIFKNRKKGIINPKKLKAAIDQAISEKLVHKDDIKFLKKIASNPSGKLTKQQFNRLLTNLADVEILRDKKQVQMAKILKLDKNQVLEMLKNNKDQLGLSKEEFKELDEFLKKPPSLNFKKRKATKKFVSALATLFVQPEVNQKVDRNQLEARYLLKAIKDAASTHPNTDQGQLIKELLGNLRSAVLNPKLQDNVKILLKDMLPAADKIIKKIESFEKMLGKNFVNDLLDENGLLAFVSGKIGDELIGEIFDVIEQDLLVDGKGMKAIRKELPAAILAALKETNPENQKAKILQGLTNAVKKMADDPKAQARIKDVLLKFVSKHESKDIRKLKPIIENAFANIKDIKVLAQQVRGHIKNDMLANLFEKFAVDLIKGGKDIDTLKKEFLPKLAAALGNKVKGDQQAQALKDLLLAFRSILQDPKVDSKVRNLLGKIVPDAQKTLDQIASYEKLLGENFVQLLVKKDGLLEFIHNGIGGDLIEGLVKEFSQDLLSTKKMPALRDELVTALLVALKETNPDNQKAKLMQGFVNAVKKMANDPIAQKKIKQVISSVIEKRTDIQLSISNITGYESAVDAFMSSLAGKTKPEAQKALKAFIANLEKLQVIPSKTIINLNAKLEKIINSVKSDTFTPNMVDLMKIKNAIDSARPAISKAFMLRVYAQGGKLQRIASNIRAEFDNPFIADLVEKFAADIISGKLKPDKIPSELIKAAAQALSRSDNKSISDKARLVRDMASKLKNILTNQDIHKDVFDALEGLFPAQNDIITLLANLEKKLVEYSDLGDVFMEEFQKVSKNNMPFQALMQELQGRGLDLLKEKDPMKALQYAFMRMTSDKNVPPKQIDHMMAVMKGVLIQTLTNVAAKEVHGTKMKDRIVLFSKDIGGELSVFVKAQVKEAKYDRVAVVLASIVLFFSFMFTANFKRKILTNALQRALPKNVDPSVVFSAASEVLGKGGKTTQQTEVARSALAGFLAGFTGFSPRFTKLVVNAVGRNLQGIHVASQKHKLQGKTLLKKHAIIS